MKSTVTQGTHGSGARDYTADQYRRVVEAVKSAHGELTVDDLAKSTGIPGRTVREIVSAADGVDFLLGGSGNGYRLAVCIEDAEPLSNRLESQVGKMTKRLDRRRDYGDRYLTRRQPGLFS